MRSALHPVPDILLTPHTVFSTQLLPAQGTPPADQSFAAAQPAVNGLEWVVATVVWCEHGRHLPPTVDDSWLPAAEAALRLLHGGGPAAGPAADGAAVWATRFLQQLALHNSPAQVSEGSTSGSDSRSLAGQWSKLWQVGTKLPRAGIVTH